MVPVDEDYKCFWCGRVGNGVYPSAWGPICTGRARPSVGYPMGTRLAPSCLDKVVNGYSREKVLLDALKAIMQEQVFDPIVLERVAQFL